MSHKEHLGLLIGKETAQGLEPMTVGIQSEKAVRRDWVRDGMKAPVKIASWRKKTFEVVLWDRGQLRQFRKSWRPSCLRCHRNPSM